jgi:hypothetical protein
MKHKEQLAALQDIRAIMERSARFGSLSGIAGILVGCFGIIGATVAYFYLGGHFSLNAEYFFYETHYENWGWRLRPFAVAWGTTLVVLSVGVSVFFSARLAKKNNQSMWDATVQRSLINFMIPMATGGLVCLILLQRNFIGIVPAMTLIFFGLSLVNVSKYTVENARYLGYVEIILGLICLQIYTYGLLFWGLGFGVAILIYGVILYRKNEG